MCPLSEMSRKSNRGLILTQKPQLGREHLKLSLFGQQLLGASIFRFSYFEIFAAAKMLQKFKMTKYASSSDIMVATKEQ